MHGLAASSVRRSVDEDCDEVNNRKHFFNQQNQSMMLLPLLGRISNIKFRNASSFEDLHFARILYAVMIIAVF